MKNILFVTDKYCEGYGLSNVFHNVFETCDESGLFARQNLFIDELVKQNNHIDQELIRSLDNIQVIVFSYLASTTYMNPSLATIRYIKSYFPHIKLVFLWWDGVYAINRNQIVALNEFADLHVNFDASDIPSDKAFFNGVPQSSRLFHPDLHTQFASFAGASRGYADRTSFLLFLQGKTDINIRGGRSQENLSAEGYAEVIRTSDVNINFCKTASGLAQCKGRVWEVLASKTLLLEQYNDITARYLVDKQHCVYFDSPASLLNSIEWLRANPDIVRSITDNAYQLYQTKYQSSILWNHIYNV